MNETAFAITVNNDNDIPTVSGRELHSALRVKTQYSMWFDRMCDYGFAENTDYFTVTKNVYRDDGREMPQKQTDHILTIDMAKELCMIQRTDVGKRCRQYFLDLERKWKTASNQRLAKPDSYMIEDPIERAKRWIEEAQERKALAMENHELSITNEMLSQKNEEQRMTITAMEPKARFADAVVGTDKAIMVGELAAILSQNGFDIGQNRLFEWLRRNRFLVKSGTRYNQPTSYSMKLGLFEVLERVIYLPNGNTDLKFTPKVTPKGQKFFVRLFLSGKANYR